MKKEKPNGEVEIFTEDSIVTLFDDKDNPIDFFEVACVEYEEKFYAIMQPVECEEGEEDLAAIFEYYAEEGSDEKLYKPISDEDLLESVFSLYLTAAADFEVSSQGCSCSSCKGSCCRGDGLDANVSDGGAKVVKEKPKKSTTKKAPAKK